MKIKIYVEGRLIGSSGGRPYGRCFLQKPNGYVVELYKGRSAFKAQSVAMTTQNALIAAGVDVVFVDDVEWNHGAR